MLPSPMQLSLTSNPCPGGTERPWRSRHRVVVLPGRGLEVGQSRKGEHVFPLGHSFLPLLLWPEWQQGETMLGMWEMASLASSGVLCVGSLRAIGAPKKIAPVAFATPCYTLGRPLPSWEREISSSVTNHKL